MLTTFQHKPRFATLGAGVRLGLECSATRFSEFPARDDARPGPSGLHCMSFLTASGILFSHENPDRAARPVTATGPRGKSCLLRFNNRGGLNQPGRSYCVTTPAAVRHTRARVGGLRLVAGEPRDAKNAEHRPKRAKVQAQQIREGLLCTTDMNRTSNHSMEHEALRIHDLHCRLTGFQSKLVVYERALTDYLKAGYTESDMNIVLQFIKAERRNKRNYSSRLDRLIDNWNGDGSRSWTHFDGLLSEARAISNSRPSKRTARQTALEQLRPTVCEKRITVADLPPSVKDILKRIIR